jgi:transposase
MRALRATELVPSGFIVENVAIDAERVVVAVRASAASCPCPLCGAAARRVHSRYLRRLVDLPVAGRSTELVLRARRFFCDASGCQRRVFSERFEGAVGRHARRSARLDDVVHCLAITLGGRPAAT